MSQVFVLGLLFVGSHFGMSLAPVRGALVGRFGEGGFLGLYSLVSAVTLVLLVLAYGEVSRLLYWWYPAPQLNLIAKVMMWFAVVLVVGSFMAPNPSSVGMGDKAKAGPSGVLRITRHPLLWGVGIWGLAHLLANGDVVSVVFFGWFIVLAAGGALLLDAKKAEQLGEDWQGFSEQTSLLPFGAVISGRTSIVAAQLMGPIAVGSLIYALMYLGHRWLSGVELTFF